jgi:hypothetical protein
MANQPHRKNSMTFETWEQLFETLGSSAISDASEGRISKQQAQYWKDKGLPTTEHTGLGNRANYLVKAAKAKGYAITKTEVLRLSTRFRNALALAKVAP